MFDDYIDDASISDDTILLRRIPLDFIKKDEIIDKLRPQSNAFTDSTTDSGMSVFLVEPSNDIAVIIKEALQNIEIPCHIYKLTAKQVRELNLKIVRKPLPNQPNHANVFGEKTKKIKKGLARMSEHIYTHQFDT